MDTSDRIYYYFISRFFGVFIQFKQRIFIEYFTRQVKSHYEVDQSLYSLFLDEEMIYTCAFYQNEDETLEQAQINKIDTIINRISLPSTAKVLDIGCGWGAFARRLVQKQNNVDVVGLSISKNQLNWARTFSQKQLCSQEYSRIDFRLEDYLFHCPQNPDTYNAVVVIGMIEHVGLGHYHRFLNCIYETLQSMGKALIHTIISPTSKKPSNRWIDKHIFPGGYTPSIPELLGAVEKTSFIVENVFLHEGINYWNTIRDWRANFDISWNTLRNERMSQFSTPKIQEQFFRTWYFYLSSVQNMFDEGLMGFKIAQILLKK